jgi:hypothetical protein
VPTIDSSGQDGLQGVCLRGRNVRVADVESDHYDPNRKLHQHGISVTTAAEAVGILQRGSWESRLCAGKCKRHGILGVFAKGRIWLNSDRCETTLGGGY